MRIITHKATAIQSFDFGTLASGYDTGTFTPVEVAHAVVARIAAAGDDRVWISRVPDAALLARVNQYEVHKGETRCRRHNPFAHRGLREKRKRWRNGLSSASEN
jgi:hypothetical protein